MALDMMNVMSAFRDFDRHCVHDPDPDPDTTACKVCGHTPTPTPTHACPNCNAVNTEDLCIAPSVSQYYNNTTNTANNNTTTTTVVSGLMKSIQLTNLFCNGPSHKDRSERVIFNDLVVRAKTHDLSMAIIEDSKALYREVSTHPATFRVRKVNLIAACVYEACKRHRTPRSAKEIANIFRIKCKAFSLGCKHFRNAVEFTSSTIAVPEDFLPRFMSGVGLSKKEACRCCDVLERVQEMHHRVLYNCAPQSLAAACICLSNPDISSTRVAEACGVSKGTIDKCIREIASSITLSTAAEEEPV